MDTGDDPDISFNEDGICNHCTTYTYRAETFAFKGDKAKEELEKVVNQIKADGKGKPYDCVMGVSGGVDSTYMALLAKELGLRPLVLHLDNGWDSELAVKNIEHIVNKLGFDLYTWVINWEEFKDLQLSYLKASVIDLEATSDHAIVACAYHIARKHKIKHILSGFNIATEGILPKAWRWAKYDLMNLEAIHKKYGSKRLKTFPKLGFFGKIWVEVILGIRQVQMLNYVPYNKVEAKQRIIDELGWKDYGGKHFESIITRFYQGYILPRKFGVDKRKAHLSTLVNSGQLTREEALEQIQHSDYSEEQQREDKAYVVKKLGLTEAEFDTMMNEAPRPHTDFPSYETSWYIWHERFFRTISPLTRLIKWVLGIRTEKRRAY
jgi:N-acetyl sugar amidotransferase